MKSYNEAQAYLNGQFKSSAIVEIYSEDKHEEVLILLEKEQKLSAVKLIKETLGLGLKESKELADFISEFVRAEVKPYFESAEATYQPVVDDLVTDDKDNVLDKILDLINQGDYSTPALRALLSHIPEHVLTGYLNHL